MVSSWAADCTGRAEIKFTCTAFAMVTHAAEIRTHSIWLLSNTQKIVLCPYFHIILNNFIQNLLLSGGLNNQMYLIFLKPWNIYFFLFINGFQMNYVNTYGTFFFWLFMSFFRGVTHVKSQSANQCRTVCISEIYS